ncbi:unnamed protein product [Paramecium sonneborni]|uniref:Alpha-glucosidase n=1 Tax=Paramecium sonneborni TaxID=65129 RepID=A0A8S1R488_9CILI|nr:unnamed protein product [Paramecium sonneborni]CAD8121896.1 unnamed protein product [Paramecium sonneborni]
MEQDSLNYHIRQTQNKWILMVTILMLLFQSSYSSIVKNMTMDWKFFKEENQQQNWKTIQNKDGFKIFTKNGVLLISHTSNQPWIFAGNGKANYTMYRGNFKINENLNEKMALKDFELEEKSDTLTATFSRNNLLKVKVQFYSPENSSQITIKFLEYDPEINRLWLRIQADAQEHIYGCGEQFSYFDLRGKNFPLWTSEQGVGRNKSTYTTFLADLLDQAGGDYYSTFFPQPTYTSSKKYYLHIDDSSYMDFNFKNKEFHELLIWSIPKQIIINSASTFIELLEKLTILLGRQPKLPEWIYNGVWLGLQGGTSIIEAKLNKALEKGIKVSALWCQDWEGIRYTSFGKRLMWNWQWDPELYPGLDQKINILKEQGIRFMGYINPYLAAEKNLCKEASEKGYLAKNMKGEDYLVDFGEFDAGIVDFTNPDAYKWYKELIKKNLIEFGLSGWMADFGEYLPLDIKLQNGESGDMMHNKWPELWARINYEAVLETGKLNDVVYFMRAGYTGSQNYSTAMWAGDQNVDWSLDDGLASVIPAALSLGMCGHGIHHSDIGGYTTLFEMKRTKELFMRWAEMAAFTPIMRTHEGNRPTDNWQFDSDDETLEHFAKMTNIYVELAPYLKSVIQENADKGIPAQRPLFLHYENDERTYSIKYQYLLGRDILVAPVYQENVQQWNFYLPDDQWIHFWTEEIFQQGDHQIDAPIGQPIAFYRKDSQYKSLFQNIKKKLIDNEIIKYI